MKIILGLVGLMIGLPICYNGLVGFRVFPFIIGLIITVIGWKILTGKIKL